MWKRYFGSIYYHYYYFYYDYYYSPTTTTTAINQDTYSNINYKNDSVTTK